MAIYRSDNTLRSLPGGATAQQYTNVDFRDKADPTLSIPPPASHHISKGLNLSIVADPIEITFSFRFLLSSYPAADRYPDLDIVFYCDYTDVHGNKDAGIPVVTVTVHGTWLNQTIIADPITITLTQHGSYPSGFTIDSDTVINIATTLATTSADIITEALKSNWIKWSNIGQMDFTIWKDNVAGERPLDWKGWVYAIKKLGGKAVTYGKNGVTLLTPAGVAWGMQTVHRIGLKGKNAIAGDESIHFFIDNKDQLFSLGESLEKLDYSEYLSVLTDPVLSYDLESNLLYICDGTYGFVYNRANKSLGECPVNVTGISSQGGTLYVAAPAAITTPAFEICTDIYDLGSRSPKDIWAVEVGTNIAQALSVCINHRKNKAGSFSSTSWITTNPSGVAFIPCYGIEFQIKVKIAAYEYFELDYINVFGAIHGY